jgi:hypothetical protein
MEIIPEDVFILIQDFLYGICNKCSKKCKFQKLVHNWKTIKYKTVFDDSYFIKENGETIRIICHHCIRNYYIRTKFE